MNNTINEAQLRNSSSKSADEDSEQTKLCSHTYITAHNWQKWNSRFLTCHCYEIHREEVIGLKSSNYTYKILIFVYMWNLG